MGVLEDRESKELFHRLACAGGARETIQAQSRAGVDPQRPVQRRAEVFR